MNSSCKKYAGEEYLARGGISIDHGRIASERGGPLMMKLKNPRIVAKPPVIVSALAMSKKIKKKGDSSLLGSVGMKM